MTRNIAVVSGATGVGKSSLVTQLSALLAQRGQRVRAVGLDRQCTVSAWYGIDIDPDDGDLYVADLLKGKPRVRTGDTDERGKPIKRMATVADIEHPTDLPGLTVVPEAVDLESDIMEIAQLGGTGDVLHDALDAPPHVDVNLMDAPGELNVLSLAAIASADSVLIVISPTIKQTSISRIMHRIDQLRERGARVQLAGIVPNIVPSSRDGAFFGEVLDELRGNGESEGHPDLMLPEIRRQHWEPTAYAMASPLPLSFPKAEVTEDYRRLLQDLDKRGVTAAAAAMS